jgi:hypothetical protein
MRHWILLVDYSDPIRGNLAGIGSITVRGDARKPSQGMEIRLGTRSNHNTRAGMVGENDRHERP